MEAQLNYANVCLHKANVCVIFKHLALFFAITQKHRPFNPDLVKKNHLEKRQLHMPIKKRPAQFGRFTHTLKYPL